MNYSAIPVNEPRLGDREKQLLIQCIETGWISSEGPFVAQLEAGLARRVGRRHAIAVANGSAALDIAMAAIKLAPGDEVILPSHTIISCASAITRAGGIPVLVDQDPHTWSMDVEAIESRITKRTVAIMAVHIYGLPVLMERVLDLAQKYNLRVIEDAAQMIGQTCHGRACGSFGDLSTFSFYPNKHITTGEGGMILTDDDHLADRCRSLRNLCFMPSRRFVHEEIGWNYRLSNLQAAVGIAQMERLEESVRRKREIGAAYRRQLGMCDGIELPLDETPYAKNIYWVFGVMLRDDIPYDAAEAMKRLGAMGVGTRPFFWPMHEQPVLRSMGLFGGERYPCAERMARRGFYLPSGLGISDEQIEDVAKRFRRCLGL